MLARENPFRTEAVLRHRYSFLNTGSLDSLTERFISIGGRAAIVGQKGRGKTTLLEDFCQHLTARGQRVAMLRLNCSPSSQVTPLCRQLLATSDTDAILVVDGAEQLNWLAWRRFQQQTRRFRGLLITTHRTGRLPPLIFCETTAAVLHDAVKNIAPAELANVRGELDSLFEQHGGNVRECLRTLYDRYAALK